MKYLDFMVNLKIWSFWSSKHFSLLAHFTFDWASFFPERSQQLSILATVLDFSEFPAIFNTINTSKKRQKNESSFIHSATRISFSCKTSRGQIMQSKDCVQNYCSTVFYRLNPQFRWFLRHLFISSHTLIIASKPNILSNTFTQVFKMFNSDYTSIYLPNHSMNGWCNKIWHKKVSF